MAMAKVLDRKISADLALQKLTLEQIKQIDALLTSLPEYGEVRLIVQKGQLRYINKVESYKAGEDGPRHLDR